MILKNYKEPERKTNQHTHSTRDQIKQGIRARLFLRKRKEVCSATDPNRVIRGLFTQKKGKRGLKTTEHALYSTIQ